MPAEVIEQPPAQKAEPQPDAAKPNAAPVPGADGTKPATPDKPPDKPADDKAKPVVEPAKATETYTLKLAEGSLLDQTDVEKIAAHAKAQGLSNEQAQALLDQRHEGAAGLVERNKAMLAEQPAKWKQEVEADPEIGGAKLTETLRVAKLAVDRFTPLVPGLKEALDETGLGNHPKMVRLFHEIGKAMAEDKPLSLPGGGGSAPKKTHGEILFPNSPPR